MSLYEHLKNLGISKDHIYNASMTDQTYFPRKVGHDANIDIITEDLDNTISNEDCSIYMYSKSNILRSAIYI